MIEEIQEQNLTASSNLPSINIELKGEYNNIEINKEKYGEALRRLPNIISGEEMFLYPTVTIFDQDNPNNPGAPREVNLPILNNEETILFFRALRYYEYLLENKREPEIIERDTSIPEWEEDENQYFKILLHNYCNINKDIPIENICKNNGREIHQITGNIKEIISSSNWKLVRSIILKMIIVKPFINSFKRDLQQEGQRSIFENAIPKFNITRGYNFSTYATWWVNHAITEYLGNHSKTIRIPMYLQNKFSEMSKILYKENLNPGPEGLSQKEMNFLRQHGFSKIAVTSYNDQLKQGMESLDNPIGDNDDNDLYDNIDNNFPSPEELLSQKEIRQEAIKRILYANLPKRTLAIFYLRFGFLEDKKTTLEDVSQMIGITRPAVRNIELQVKKLRYINKDKPTYFQNEEELREYIIYNYWIPSRIKKNLSLKAYNTLSAFYGFKDTNPKDIKSISREYGIPTDEVAKQINSTNEKIKKYILPVTVDPNTHNYLEYLESRRSKISFQ